MSGRISGEGMSVSDSGLPPPQIPKKTSWRAWFVQFLPKWMPAGNDVSRAAERIDQLAQQALSGSTPKQRKVATDQLIGMVQRLQERQRTAPTEDQQSIQEALVFAKMKLLEIFDKSQQLKPKKEGGAEKQKEEGAQGLSSEQRIDTQKRYGKVLAAGILTEAGSDKQKIVELFKTHAEELQGVGLDSSRVVIDSMQRALVAQKKLTDGQRLQIQTAYGEVIARDILIEAEGLLAQEKLSPQQRKLAITQCAKVLAVPILAEARGSKTKIIELFSSQALDIQRVSPELAESVLRSLTIELCQPPDDKLQNDLSLVRAQVILPTVEQLVAKGTGQNPHDKEVFIQLARRSPQHAFEAFYQIRNRNPQSYEALKGKIAESTWEGGKHLLAFLESLGKLNQPPIDPQAKDDFVRKVRENPQFGFLALNKLAKLNPELLAQLKQEIEKGSVEMQTFFRIQELLKLPCDSKAISDMRILLKLLSVEEVNSLNESLQNWVKPAVLSKVEELSRCFREGTLSLQMISEWQSLVDLNSTIGFMDVPKKLLRQLLKDLFHFCEKERLRHPKGQTIGFYSRNVDGILKTLSQIASCLSEIEIQEEIEKLPKLRQWLLSYSMLLPREEEKFQIAPPPIDPGQSSQCEKAVASAPEDQKQLVRTWFSTFPDPDQTVNDLFRQRACFTDRGGRLTSMETLYREELELVRDVTVAKNVATCRFAQAMLESCSEKTPDMQKSIGRLCTGITQGFSPGGVCTQWIGSLSRYCTDGGDRYALQDVPVGATSQFFIDPDTHACKVELTTAYDVIHLTDPQNVLQRVKISCSLGMKSGQDLIDAAVHCLSVDQPSSASS
jgi:hypothetical protein